MKNTQLIKRFKFAGFRLDIDKPISGFFNTAVKNKIHYPNADAAWDNRGIPATKDYFFYFARTNNHNGLSGWTLLIWKLKFYLIYGENDNAV